MTHLPKNVTSHLHLSHFVAWTIWLTGTEGSNSIKNAIRLCLYSCNSHWGGGDLSTGVHGLCCFFAIHKIIFSCFSHSHFPVLPPLSEEHNPSFEQIEEGCGYMNKKTDTVSEGPAKRIVLLGLYINRPQYLKARPWLNLNQTTFRQFRQRCNECSAYSRARDCGNPR